MAGERSQHSGHHRMQAGHRAVLPVPGGSGAARARLDFQMPGLSAPAAPAVLSADALRKYTDGT